MQSTKMTTDVYENKLVKMIVKSHLGDVLTQEQCDRLTSRISKGVLRVTDEIGAIHIFAEQEMLDVDTFPLYLIPRKFAHLHPLHPWVQPYRYMYKISLNQMSSNIVIVAAINTAKGVKIFRMLWSR